MFDRLFGGGIADQNGIRNILFETALSAPAVWLVGALVFGG